MRARARARWLGIGSLAVTMLSACPAEESDGEVTYTCTYAYTFEDGTIEEGVFSSHTISCGTYIDVGDQLRLESATACQADGEEVGAVESDCSCTWQDGYYQICPGTTND